MTKFVKKHRSQFGRVSVVMLTIAGLVMMGGLTVMFVGTADALELSNRSDVLEDSEHSVANVDHTFTFTTSSVLSTDGGIGDDFSIIINFPTGTIADPYAMPNFANGDVTVSGASCGNVAGFTVTNVAESSNDGADGENDEIAIVVTDDDDDAVDVPIGCVFTVVLGNGATAMNNPADNPNVNDGAANCTDGVAPANADVCSIALGTANDINGGASPTIVDNGDVLVAHISDVTVSVTVDESLTFDILAVTNTGGGAGTCDTEFGVVLDGPDSTSNAVDFGTVSTFNTFIHACQELNVVTNSANGYNVTIESDTSLQSSGGVEIDSGTCEGVCTSLADDTWTTNTLNGFAIACKTQSDDDAGSACDDALTAETTRYRRIACAGVGADCTPGASEAPVTVMEDTSTGDDDVWVEYKLSIANTQAAAVYSTQVTYIATPTF